ncbi:UDP-glucose 4-epimerase GalE [Pararhodospirillum oryzae]|uniref:UDP-glucose 4-epimerase n=1 Tax=Pararhodospirillum oryzae TaxID=478448 RepID=A0A512H406_9PROT|nr:UDP-glucose 4-epimerase GalE [Pararhodospirillum oryzae]GEO80138.1 UDP-glucose 4-epimerase GalE [Pararhodospirillum oryzae]
MRSQYPVLVTGGAGFVGSHACKALARAGYGPVVYDSLVGGVAEAVQWGPLEKGCLSERDRLLSVFDRYRPVAVLHFAGFIEAGESVHAPRRFYRNNVALTLALLDVMRASGVDILVFSSSAAVYGMPDAVPIPENHPLHPVSPYGWTKAMVEQMLADAAAAEGLRYAALRYFNASGAHPDGDLAENHAPETHLIPLAIQAAFGARPPLSVFGTDYDTPDGTCIRDYVHVCDLADAHVLALRHLLEGGDSLVVNLGVGRGASVRDVVDTVGAVTGRPVPTMVAPRRPGDPAVLVADPRRAEGLLGWRPRYTVLSDHVAHAVAALRSRPAALSPG